MNTVITSREAILAASRQLALTEGWKAVNMRSVASACGIAVGSLYNYFHSKSELTAATVESVWQELFHMPEGQEHFDSFLECARWFFQSVQTGSQKYPGFFTVHSITFDDDGKELGRRTMERSFDHMKKNLCRILHQDQNVRPGAFDDSFTEEGFIEMIFSLILSALLQGAFDFSMIAELIQRSIY
ncbi:MAG: TetR/AcrR family transcriptional regulator [Blautia sp.]|jgi:AcrR family transcriptional regulator